MRKSFKLFSLLLSLAFIMGLSSCSKKGDLLSYVPADAPIVVYGDLNYLLEQVGFTKKGEIEEPLKSIMEKANMYTSEFRQDAAFLKNYTKEAVLFFQGNKMWVIAGMTDTKAIIKEMANRGCTTDKESGVEIVKKGNDVVMFKDNKMFLCIDVVNERPLNEYMGVNDLCKLGNDSFASSKEMSKLTKKLKKDKSTLFGLVNLERLSTLASYMNISQQELSNAQMAYSWVYNNPKYIDFFLNINKKGVNAVLEIRNSDMDPAKFSLPLGKIDVGALQYAYIANNSIAVAASIPNSLVTQVTNLISNYVPQDLISALNGLNGTVGCTLNLVAKTADDGVAYMATCNSNNDAVQLGKIFQTPVSGLKCSTSGNYLRITFPGTSSSTSSISYASILEGKPFGAVCDLNLLIQNAGLSGTLSDMGTMAIYGDNEDGSLAIKFEWNVDEPVKKVFDLVNNYQTIFKALGNTGSFGSGSSYSSSYDFTDDGYEEDTDIEWDGF